MNILITGANGLLGNEMRDMSVEYPEHTYFFTDVNELDITDKGAVFSFVSMNAIDLIVNCAAYTNVDKAEDDEEFATKLNATAVKNLAEVASTFNAKLIHISTDYVFDGTSSTPYKETDSLCPKTVYGRTKDLGESYATLINKETIIFRTAWLYSTYGNNFVKTMIKLGKERDELKVVFDQIGTPTYARDLARVIFVAINDWHPGVYHFSNEGSISWYDFTKAIHEIAGINCNVLPIRSTEYQYKTPRPSYSVLDKSLVKRIFDITIPYWKDSLKDCIEKLK